ncbi:hypothetical protein [Wolbachia endosymbiont (group A) of Agelastica alni]
MQQTFIFVGNSKRRTAVIPVLLFLSSQCPDTGIQVAHKQTSIESGYNVFDEIAERLDSSVKHWNDRKRALG